MAGLYEHPLRICFSTALLILLSTTPAIAAAELSVEQIRSCTEANRPEESSEVDVVLRSKDRSDVVTELEAKMYWKDMGGKANVLLRLSAPPKYRGAAVLILEKSGDKRDLFMYLPELGRVKRVAGSMMSGSIFGTDFSYEEFERMQGFIEDLSGKRLADAEIDGRAAYVVEYRPRKPEDSSYQRTVEYIDIERCLPLKIEFYGHGDRQEKVLETDTASIEQLGDKWITRDVKIRDLIDGTNTVMQMKDVKFDGKVPRKLFSTKELVSGGH